MQFNTILFLFRFLPVMMAVYYIIPAKLKNAALLLGSLVFYAFADLRSLWVLVALVLVHYVCGIAVGKSSKKAVRLIFALSPVLCAVLALFFYKYRGMVPSSSLAASIAVPLGISFYTLRLMSYVMDVYRKEIAPEKNILHFATYAFMFPYVSAGPLVRYSAMQTQLQQPQGRVNMAKVDSGIQEFILGLSKKVLLADSLGALWAAVVGTYRDGRLVLGSEGLGLANTPTALAWLALLALVLQVYFDFSAYCSMAVGLGRMLGFEMEQNFDHPFAARSITSFWSKWNVSLFAWLKDYVYKPLSGAKGNKLRIAVGLLVVCALGGLWYGAGFNFLLFGLYFFVFIVMEKLWLGKLLTKSKALAHLYTLAVVLLGWILFASGGGVELPVLLGRLFVPHGGAGTLYYLRAYALPLAAGILTAGGLSALIFKKVAKFEPLRLLVLGVLLLACIAYMAAGASVAFVTLGV